MLTKISISTLFLVVSITIMGPARASERKVILSKKFLNNNTYQIVARGYPATDAEGIKKRITAKEAALLNAQGVASTLFSKSLDVVKSGKVFKYSFNGRYATLYYRIHKPNLRLYYIGEKGR